MIKVETNGYLKLISKGIVYEAEVRDVQENMGRLTVLLKYKGKPPVFNKDGMEHDAYEALIWDENIGRWLAPCYVDRYGDGLFEALEGHVLDFNYSKSYCQKPTFVEATTNLKNKE